MQFIPQGLQRPEVECSTPARSGHDTDNNGVVSVRRLYLDQFVFIRLAQAHLRRPGSGALWETREALWSEVQIGSVVVPLSSVHYTEIWGTGSHVQRVELSAEMAVLSRLRTIAPARTLRSSEIDMALHATFGKPKQCKPLDVFGFGVAHAFGMSELMLNKDHYTPEQLVAAELSILSGLEGNDQLIDAERKRYETEDKFAEHETSRAKRLKNWLVEGDQRATRFRIQAFSDFESYVLPSLIAADITKEELEQLGSSGLEALISAVPSLFVLTELRRLRYANPAQGFRRTDMNDLRALSVAVPYCDVVVTDKAMVDLLMRSRLPEKYGTKVFAKVTDALTYLKGSY